MRKKLIVICLIYFLIIVSLSGCFESSDKTNFKNKFIGSWEGASYFENVSNNITLTFFEDNTAKQEDENAHIHWFTFDVDDKYLKLMLPELPKEYAIYYRYEFSNNNTSLTLKNESLDTILLNKQ